MSKIKKRAFTLVELLLALALAGVVIIGFTSLDTFGRYQVMTTDRLAKAQNELTLVADHMSKQVSKGIGNEVLFGIRTVARSDPIIPYVALRVYADTNNNGIRDDVWIAYRWRDAGPDAYQVQYCAQCQNANCNNCNTGWQVISGNVSFFQPTYFTGDNFVEVTVEACWDPGNATYPCGEPRNPRAEATFGIKMPSVSLN
ncbi:MAG: prepilin-type N-terminal cleavage/methylation domain-containing protein [Candidatus Omnitrophota bacterium]|nr:MAG: prepilin-type N-terminal cleavage/methylation domain-containing protein [Candidatus Omnitrophota bacterium]